LKEDKRILGMAAGGSLVLNNVDEFSDLDLVIVIDPSDYENVLKERKSIAKSLGPLLESFTGEHVGEPRLLICLYGPPLLHVDLKFISLDDIDDRVEDPVIIWERDSILSNSISRKKSKYPSPDIKWIDNRFWVWIHYISGKIGRGELFDVIESLSFLRSNVFGPMILYLNNARPQGVRRIEQYAGDYLERLKLTLAKHDQKSCMTALNTAISLYEDLRKILIKNSNLQLNIKLINEVKTYLNSIEKRVFG
ncbi:MAG: aminoglycoside 6-adenylyltransferase, partial [Calditrichaceae bacterium]